ncbi:MAG: hypothetical protein ACRC6Z_04815 [Cetobacterium sp.]
MREPLILLRIEGGRGIIDEGGWGFAERLVGWVPPHKLSKKIKELSPLN